MWVYDTPENNPITLMANKRRKGVERVTLTIPDEMLALIEEDAERRGIDRLAVMREAINSYLTHTPKPKTSAKPSK
jgi:metal-responsive CopG/Arc/MetJ family transcriptional regulator